MPDIVPYMHCPSKIDRARLLLNEYETLTVRNGQYTLTQRAAREDMEARFMAIGHGRGSSMRVA